MAETRRNAPIARDRGGALGDDAIPAAVPTGRVADSGSVVDGLYGSLLDTAQAKAVYIRAGEPGVFDEIRLVRLKIWLAEKEGRNQEVQSWMEQYIRLRNLEARIGARDEDDFDYLTAWEERQSGAESGQ